MIDEALREKIQGKSPKEIADIMGLPWQRALIDFEMSSERLQTIGADPTDLTDKPTIPVKTIITSVSVLTIMAHPGAEQDVANAFAWRLELSGWAAGYGEDYLEQGVMDFAFRPLTGQEIRNAYHNARIMHRQEGSNDG